VFFVFYKGIDRMAVKSKERAENKGKGANRYNSIPEDKTPYKGVQGQN